MKVPGESFVPNKINGLEPRRRADTRIRRACFARRDAGAGSNDARAPPTCGSPARHATWPCRGITACAARSGRTARRRREATLQDGSYEIDPQRVADRLLRMEVDLRTPRPSKPVAEVRHGPANLPGTAHASAHGRKFLLAELEQQLRSEHEFLGQ